MTKAFGWVPAGCTLTAQTVGCPIGASVPSRRRQARRPVRGPQDPPAGLPHPGRARRRRTHRRL